MRPGDFFHFYELAKTEKTRGSLQLREPTGVPALDANAIKESDPKRSQLHRDFELGLKVVDRIVLYDRDPNFQRDHEVVGHLPTHGHVEREK